MMSIFIGPAGIPTVAEDRSTLGGIRKVAELKLNAMEVEYVRGVKMSIEMAEEVGKLAKELNIKLSCHCPYYTNLCSQEKQKLEATKKMIIDSALRANAMNADIVVCHPGYYQRLTPEKAFESVKQACLDIIERMKSQGIKNVRLGLETMGKQSTFGSLDEIIKICKEVKGFSPVIDFAHINCRTAGSLRKQEDYSKIFDLLKPLKLDCLHTHVTCAEYTQVGIGKGNEKHHLTIDVKKPDFEPLVKEILKRKIDITLISESPTLEQDALILKGMFEKYGYKF